MGKSLKIANSSGFWGDDPFAMLRQAEAGQIDYIVSDYLAEVSMSILQKQQSKNPDAGYIQDYIRHFVKAAPHIVKHKIRLVTNAGGNNPLACARQLLKELEKIGLTVKIAIVEGDNIMPIFNDLLDKDEEFENFETGELLGDKSSLIKSANAYVGVPALLKALQTGAQVIIAGRATDSAVAIAPMVHELGWELNDWDKLGAGMIAAHIIECGGQSTGGNFTDWETIEKWDNFGFPIIDMFENGDFQVYKHPNTGGAVTVNTVKEQLVYEIADPANYFGPDVIADLTQLHVSQVGKDKVMVTGGKGKVPTPFFKLSMAYEHGFKAVGSIIISGPNALKKAQKFGEIFWQRLGLKYEKHKTEFVGYNACHLNLAKEIDPNEILLRFHAMDADKEKLEAFSQLLASLILTGPPGVAVTGGRPEIQQVMAYWPALLHKSLVPLTVKLLNNKGEVENEEIVESYVGNEVLPVLTKPEKSTNALLEGMGLNERMAPAMWRQCRLNELCLARSGDKGNSVNIGVIVRDAQIYDFIKETLSSDLVKYWFRDLCKGEVFRYELHNLNAFNFVLTEALDGGGTLAMRIDAQGKTFASALLNQIIAVPEDIYNLIRK
jgi:hypothetical protein